MRADKAFGIEPEAAIVGRCTAEVHFVLQGSKLDVFLLALQCSCDVSNFDSHRLSLVARGRLLRNDGLGLADDSEVVDVSTLNELNVQVVADRHSLVAIDEIEDGEILLATLQLVGHLAHVAREHATLGIIAKILYVEVVGTVIGCAAAL